MLKILSKNEFEKKTGCNVDNLKLQDLTYHKDNWKYCYEGLLLDNDVEIICVGFYVTSIEGEFVGYAEEIEE